MVTGATRWMVSLLFPSSKLALYPVVFVEAKPLTLSQHLTWSLKRDPKYRYCIAFLFYPCSQVHCAGVFVTCNQRIFVSSLRYRGVALPLGAIVYFSPYSVCQLRLSNICIVFSIYLINAIILFNGTYCTFPVGLN